MQVLHVSEADRQVFSDVLIDSPEPTERLKRAFEMHGRRVRSVV